MFAPESRDAPVQVMGPLEAAGGTFDAVWFLRAGELSWPMETAKQFPAAVAAAARPGDAGNRRCAGQRVRAADDGADREQCAGRWCSAMRRESAEGRAAAFACAGGAGA